MSWVPHLFIHVYANGVHCLRNILMKIESFGILHLCGRFFPASRSSLISGYAKINMKCKIDRNAWSYIILGVVFIRRATKKQLSAPVRKRFAVSQRSWNHLEFCNTLRQVSMSLNRAPCDGGMLISKNAMWKMNFRHFQFQNNSQSSTHKRDRHILNR